MIRPIGVPARGAPRVSRRCPHPDKLLARAAAALPLLLLLLAPAGAPEATESFAQQLLRAGEKEMLELRYAEAVAYLSEAIKLAEASSNESDRALIPRVYELRGIAYLNLGDAPAAEKDFAALVDADPSRDLDRSLLSPKILGVFDRVRAARTGLLTLHCDPPDCRVRLGPGMVEILAPVAERRVRAGRYEVQIERQGFEPAREVWEVAPGQRLERHVRLHPNSQSFQVLTIPPGASVSLDGAVVGTTQGPAPPQYQDRARQAGVTLAELSAPLLIAYVPVGRHELKIERECHQTARFALEVRPDMRSTTPATFKPVRLKAELSTLEVHGSPAGGEVRIDGAPAGRVPLRRERVCAGAHQVEVRFPTGASFVETVELPAGATYRVQAHPRPTLAFLGLVQVGSEVRVDSRQVEARLRDHLRSLRQFNVERRDRDEKGRAAWPAIVSAAPLEAADGSGDLLAGRLGEWARTSLERGQADVFLGAVLGRRRQADEVSLYAASSLGAPAEVRRVPAASAEALAAAFRTLDRPLELQEVWAGWAAIDLPGGGPPVIASIAPDSPAARAGLRTGDRIRALDDEPVGDAAGLARLLEAVSPGEVVRLDVLSREGREAALRLTPLARPRVLPLASPEFMYHAAHAHLKYALLGQTDPAVVRLAALNLGVVLLHFGKVEEALRSYLQPRAGGALESVEHYLRARALERLGDREAARSALQAAARARASDLEPADLPVSLLAAEALATPAPR